MGGHKEILLFIFAALAFSAAFLMLLPVKGECENPDVKCLTFYRWRAVTAASTVGLLGGLIGQGGSFILIPLMTSFVRIPTKITIGSNLAIVLLSSMAGFISKAATGQIEWLMAAPIVLTVVPAARLGSLGESEGAGFGAETRVSSLDRYCGNQDLGLGAIRVETKLTKKG